MIQHTLSTWQDLSWQDELKSLITRPEVLLSMLDLDPSLLPAAEQAAKHFPLRVTPSFVQRIRKGDINDPLLKQILPIHAELEDVSGYSDDPLEESRFNPLKGLVHKYTRRVLLIATTSCAINCRYCFRRAFDYKNNRMSKEDWQAIFDYISERPAIDEVIFSGGDPLMHSDAHFEWVITALANIKHVERVRIHSRLPIVLPSRITSALLQSLSSTRLQPVLVVHSNHANEIDRSVAEALNKTREAGITVLNQTVLLKGVNDNVTAQTTLNKTLFDCKVLPYYLHMLDRVNGSAHFELSEQQAFTIYSEMREQLPGYLLPKLVREEAGESAKTVVFP